MQLHHTVVTRFSYVESLGFEPGRRALRRKKLVCLDSKSEIYQMLAGWCNYDNAHFDFDSTVFSLAKIEAESKKKNYKFNFQHHQDIFLQANRHVLLRLGRDRVEKEERETIIAAARARHGRHSVVLQLDMQQQKNVVQANKRYGKVEIALVE